MMKWTVVREISPEADEFMEARNRRENASRPPIDPAATAVTVHVLDGQAITTTTGSYVRGDTFKTSAEQARRLVELGIVK